MRSATDEDVRAIAADEVVGIVREALIAHQAGQLAAPARVIAELPELGDARLRFTVGGFGSLAGFRVYANGRDLKTEQLTVVYDLSDGSIKGIVSGLELGARRTAAIGAVAVDALSRPDSRTLGLIGSGLQAFAHVWAVRAVRDLEVVRVWSRDADRRASFAERCQAELGVRTIAAASAREAVEGADMVTLATKSGTPVIEAEWVSDGAHVTTLGPKSAREHEAPIGIAIRAAAIVTDSLTQLFGYGEESWLSLAGERVADVRTLGSVLAFNDNGRTNPEDITLFSSVGLAGTEVLVADRVLEATTC